MAGEWLRGQFTIDNVLHTQTNIINGFESFLLQVGWIRASWSGSGTDRYYLRSDRNTQPRWQFTGDGGIKHGGIRIFYDSAPDTTTGIAAFAGQKHIVIQPFLENAAQTGAQVLTQDVISTTIPFGASTTFRLGTIRVMYDNTAPNTYLVIGGEDGLYVEVGRDALNNNLGHGAILTFGAIPENHSAIDHTVNWTAQGLSADLFGVCRFTHSRNNRFVTNDGSNKNFTAALQPQSPRGTSSIVSPQYDTANGGVRAYYIGSRDVMVGMGRAAASDAFGVVVSVSGSVDLSFHATFGLFNSPENGRFRISPLLMLQTLISYAMAVSSNSATDTVAAAGGTSQVFDPRSLRQIFRFAAVDYTLLPWVNIQDAVSGAVYRVIRVGDNGRFAHLGVQWPAQSFLSISV